jgi:hypothetical protein
MNLSKKSLARICAYHRTGNEAYGNSRFSENEDGGIIYIQHHRIYVDTEITIFAVKRGNDELTPDKLDELSYLHPLFIVLPCDIMNPDLLLTLENLESHWEERNPLNGKKEKDDNRYSLRNMFMIYLVADAGKDSSTDEKRYAYEGFSPEAIENITKRELVKQGAPQNLDILSISGFKMRTTLRKHIISNGSQVTLRQVNEHIKKA